MKRRASTILTRSHRGRILKAIKSNSNNKTTKIRKAARVAKKAKEPTRKEKKRTTTRPLAKERSSVESTPKSGK